MATTFAERVRARVRALLERHDLKPHSAELARRLGRPRSFMDKKLREPPVHGMSLDDVDEILGALGESPEAVLRNERKKPTTTTRKT